MALFLLATPASAAPIHPFLPDASLDGSDTPSGDFDKACGVAADSEGDVYVASAGNGAIEIFDSEGNYLTSIANANEPCGLAVDTDGNLYASEQATGNVVKYEPAEYPFAGAPSYGPADPVDESGEAKGIAVDPYDDRLYVARGDHVAAYDSTGKLGIDEVQRVRVDAAVTAGGFTLAFEGEETAPIAFDASHAQVQSALEGLAAIGAGNVSVGAGPQGARDHLIAFVGTLAATDVDQLVADGTALVGGGVSTPGSGATQGWDGRIGEGELTEATGVATYTYDPSGFSADRRYVSVADAATGEIRVFTGTNVAALTHRHTIDGSGTPDGDLGFGADASLAVDRGTCPPAGQACTAGHLFAYDAERGIVNEFEASGAYLTQIESPGFADAGPSAIAVDRSGGPREGTLYVTAGSGEGAEALAFGPLPPPSRTPQPQLSKQIDNSSGVAIDSAGNVYLAADTTIAVYGPDGALLTAVDDAADNPWDMAVDAAGNVYALWKGASTSGDEKVVYYAPDSFPPSEGTDYGPPTTVAEVGMDGLNGELTIVGVNPGNGHVFARGCCGSNNIVEYDSAADGSGLVNPDFYPAAGAVQSIDGHAGSGNVYVAHGSQIDIVDSSGSELLARIDGSGSDVGPFSGATSGAGQAEAIAVDQTNGHVLAFGRRRQTIEEYEASGPFVTSFGTFASAALPSGLALDNSGGPSEGNAYLAYRDDLSAFGPLSYGEPPIAKTGLASEVGGGEATLNGSVDPRGFELEDCRFEYVAEEAFEEEGFAGAPSAPCVPDPAGIGDGVGEVEVEAEVSGLDPEARYRFRLCAENEFGSSCGEAGLFGLPLLTTLPAQPVLYSEATLRATVDPSGLPTSLCAEYGKSEAYGQSPPCAQVSGDSGPTEVQIPLFGLAEGTAYHFRLKATNEAGIATGPDQVLTTLARNPKLDCPNEALRTGRSAALPDCRAYELVTPADTRGLDPHAPTSDFMFNNWMLAPDGEGAGESLAFFLEGTLPGTEGNGVFDAYRATRGETGWASSLFSPSYEQNGGNAISEQNGVAAHQRYSLWGLPEKSSLPPGSYLRTPAGFEPLGQGSLGEDLLAKGRFVSRGAAHVLFESSAHLEDAAPPAGTTAVYDRSPGGPTRVVSLLPGELTPLGGEDASYAGVSADGSAVAFGLGGALYARRGGTTIKVADAPNRFAGISADGERVFYAGADPTGVNDVPPAGLFVFDLATETATEIAPESRFVNVPAADPANGGAGHGSRVYFTSTAVLDDAAEGTPGASNLYLSDGTGTELVAVLDPEDLFGGFASSDSGGGEVGFGRWARRSVIGPAISGGRGRAAEPSRSTPDGSVLVFQSHADLTGYETGSTSQVYRYDAAAGSTLCLSCDPSGAPPRGDGLLQFFGAQSPANAATLIPNVTADGQAVFFESEGPLLPEDANEVRDVYGWRAQGSGGCARPGGCLALVSSGKSDRDSYLYGTTRDGHDVFISTKEKLLGADVPGSPSIYDARVGGGFPEAAEEPPCEGDGCQGEATPAPALAHAAPPAGESESIAGAAGTARCAKEARRAKRLSRRASGARRAAKRAAGKRAASLRARARRLGRAAKRRSARAKRCRARARADRRAGR